MNTININDFFDPYEMRDYLSSPFNLNGRTIASNGYLIISFPQFGEFPEWDKSHYVDMGKITSQIYIDRDFKPMPDNLKFPDLVQCGVCAGTGKASVVKCQECDGEGEVELENDFHIYEFECKSCDGDGEIITKGGNDECENCSGSGSAYLITDYVDVMGVYVRPQYLNLITNVTGIEVFPDKEDRKLFFKCGDIRGLIMGMII